MYEQPQDVVFVHGPMHPDLFGGETPIMVPVKAKVYSVTVTYTTTKEKETTIDCIAGTEAEAKKEALRQAGDDAGPHDFDFEVTGIHCLDRAPTDKEMEIFRERKSA